MTYVCRVEYFDEIQNDWVFSNCIVVAEDEAELKRKLVCWYGADTIDYIVILPFSDSPILITEDMFNDVRINRHKDDCLILTDRKESFCD